MAEKSKIDNNKDGGKNSLSRMIAVNDLNIKLQQFISGLSDKQKACLMVLGKYSIPEIYARMLLENEVTNEILLCIADSTPSFAAEAAERLLKQNPTKDQLNHLKGIVGLEAAVLKKIAEFGNKDSKN